MDGRIKTGAHQIKTTRREVDFGGMAGRPEGTGTSGGCRKNSVRFNEGATNADLPLTEGAQNETVKDEKNKNKTDG